MTFKVIQDFSTGHIQFAISLPLYYYVLYCLLTSLVLGEPVLMGVCPSWHSAIWQINIVLFPRYYNTFLRVNNVTITDVAKYFG